MPVILKIKKQKNKIGTEYSVRRSIFLTFCDSIIS